MSSCADSPAAHSETAFSAAGSSAAGSLPAMLQPLFPTPLFFLLWSQGSGCRRQLPVKACLCQTLSFLSSSTPLFLVPIIQHDPEKSYITSSFQGLCRCRFFLWKTGALWSEYSAKMGCCVESQTRA